jgi:hypothetical protein
MTRVPCADVRLALDSVLASPRGQSLLATEVSVAWLERVQGLLGAQCRQVASDRSHIRLVATQGSTPTRMDRDGAAKTYATYTRCRHSSEVDLCICKENLLQTAHLSSVQRLIWHLSAVQLGLLQQANVGAAAVEAR